MTQTLVKTIAGFSTTLTTATAVGATTGTLTTGLDSDAVQLPTATYGFTIDRNNAQKEHFTATLTGASLTNIKTIALGTGVGVSGLLRTHRKGAEVIITDHVSLKRVTDLLDGTTSFDSATPLGYDGTATISTANQFTTKKYVDDTNNVGSASASTTTLGIVEEATQAEVIAKTAAGAVGRLFVNPASLASTLLSDYVVDTGVADAYVITPSPAITAYATGQIFSFRAVNANTTTSTLNVNGLGAQTIRKVGGGTVLAANDILASQIVMVEYDGTNFQMLNAVGNAPATSAELTVTRNEILDATPNTFPTRDTVYTYTIPLGAIAANTLAGWELTNITNPANLGFGGLTTITSSGAGGIFTLIPGSGSNSNYSPVEGKTVSVKFRLKLSTTSNIKGWGIANQVAHLDDFQAGVTDGVRFIENTGVLYAQNANGTTAISTNVSSGITRTNWNTYEIVFVPTVSAKFYINGILVATHTTNLPIGIMQGLGIGFDTTNESITTFPLIVSVQI